MLIGEDLRTDGLRLTTLSAADAEGPYVDWMQDPEVLRFLEARFQEHTVSSLKEYIAEVNAAPNAVMLAIRVTEDDRHVGNIKLGPIEQVHLRGELGIIVGDRSVRGQGVARRAINIVCAYAFNKLELKKITAGAYASNTASLRAFQNAGFDVEGRRSAHYWDAPEGWVDAVLMARFRTVA